MCFFVKTPLSPPTLSFSSSSSSNRGKSSEVLSLTEAAAPARTESGKGGKEKKKESKDCKREGNHMTWLCTSSTARSHTHRTRVRVAACVCVCFQSYNRIIPQLFCSSACKNNARQGWWALNIPWSHSAPCEGGEEVSPRLLPLEGYRAPPLLPLPRSTTPSIAWDPALLSSTATGALEFDGWWISGEMEWWISAVGGVVDFWSLHNFIISLRNSTAPSSTILK